MDFDERIEFEGSDRLSIQYDHANSVAEEILSSSLDDGSMSLAAIELNSWIRNFNRKDSTPAGAIRLNRLFGVSVYFIPHRVSNFLQPHIKMRMYSRIGNPLLKVDDDKPVDFKSYDKLDVRALSSSIVNKTNNYLIPYHVHKHSMIVETDATSMAARIAPTESVSYNRNNSKITKKSSCLRNLFPFSGMLGDDMLRRKRSGMVQLFPEYDISNPVDIKRISMIINDYLDLMSLYIFNYVLHGDGKGIGMEGKYDPKKPVDKLLLYVRVLQFWHSLDTEISIYDFYRSLRCFVLGPKDYYSKLGSNANDCDLGQQFEYFLLHRLMACKTCMICNHGMLLDGPDLIRIDPRLRFWRTPDDKRSHETEICYQSPAIPHNHGYTLWLNSDMHGNMVYWYEELASELSAGLSKTEILTYNALRTWEHPHFIVSDISHTVQLTLQFSPFSMTIDVSYIEMRVYVTLMQWLQNVLRGRSDPKYIWNGSVFLMFPRPLSVYREVVRMLINMKQTVRAGMLYLAVCTIKMIIFNCSLPEDIAVLYDHLFHDPLISQESCFDFWVQNLHQFMITPCFHFCSYLLADHKILLNDRLFEQLYDMELMDIDDFIPISYIFAVDGTLKESEDRYIKFETSLMAQAYGYVNFM